MPRTKITEEVEKFWQKLKELLGEAFDKIQSWIFVKAKGCEVVVRIEKEAARFLGLGRRRKQLCGKVERVIAAIGEAWLPA